MAAFLVIGLLVGGWVDRMRKRRVMLVADIVRAAAVTAVPAAYLTGHLEMWQLYLVAGVLSVATVFFDVAYQSYIPILVRTELVGPANGVLEAVSQTSRLGGPALAGGLLKVMAAPLLLLANAFGFAISALCLAFIRDREEPAPKQERLPLLVEIREGIAFVFGQPLLRRIITTTGLSNLGSTVVFTMTSILILREIGLAPELLGVVFTFGAVGGVLGSLLSTRVARRIGEGPALLGSVVVSAAGMVSVPAAALVPRPAALWLLCAGEVIFSAAVVVYNVVQVTARQKLCPQRLLGRMNASIRFVVWGIMPVAALAAGWIGTAIGALATIWLGVAIQALAIAPFLFSRYGRLRELPTSPE